MAIDNTVIKLIGTNQTTGDGNTMNLIIPNGTQVGDVMVAFISLQSDYNSVIPKSGWTQAITATSNAWTAAEIWYKVATALDTPGLTINLGTSKIEEHIVTFSTFRNVDNVTPFGNKGIIRSAYAPSINITNAGNWLLTHYTAFERLSMVAPQGMTLISSIDDLQAVSSAVAYEPRIAGATGSRTSGGQLSFAIELNYKASNTAPPKPGSFTEPVNSKQRGSNIAVKWGASIDPNDDAVSYELEFCYNNSGLWGVANSSLTTASTMFFILEAINNTSLQFRVRAKDAAGLKSDWTMSSVITLLNNNRAPGTIPKFVAPSGKLNQGTEYKIEWESAVDPDLNAITYSLEAKLDSGSFTSIASGFTDNFRNYRIPTGAFTNITFRVKATDIHGLQSAFTNSEVYTINNIILAPGTFLTPTEVYLARGSSYSIQWQAVPNTNGGIITYDLEYSYDNINFSLLLNTANTNYNWTTPASVVYKSVWFRVRSIEGTPPVKTLYYWDKYSTLSSTEYYWSNYNATPYTTTTYNEGVWGAWSALSTKNVNTAFYGYTSYGFSALSGYYNNGSERTYYSTANYWRASTGNVTEYYLYDNSNGVVNYKYRTKNSTSSSSTNYSKGAFNYTTVNSSTYKISGTRNSDGYWWEKGNSLTSYSKGNFVATVEAEGNAYLDNQRNSDGYWYVKRGISNGVVTSPYTVSKEYKLNSRPTAPVWTSPTAGSILRPGKATSLVWNASDGDGEVLTYDLSVIYNANATTLIATNISQNNFIYNVDSDYVNGKIAFRVIARDSKNFISNASISGEFKVQDAPTPPTINLSSTNWSSTDITVSIVSGLDTGGGIHSTEYKLDNGGWQIYSKAFLIAKDGETKIEARTLDTSLYASDVVSKIAKVDKTKPNVPTLSLTTTAWTKNDVTMNITANGDAVSGVLRNEYKIGTGEWKVYIPGNTVINIEGTSTIYARTVDLAGNYSDAVQSVTKIDKTLPTKPTIVLDNTNWTKLNVGFTLNLSSDLMSGIKQHEYKIGTDPWLIYTGKVTVSADGNTQILARSLDNAGNYSIEDSAFVKIDKSPPTKPTIRLSKIDWSNADVSFTIDHGVDSGSGVAYSEFKVDSGVWTRYIERYNVSKTGLSTISARTIDNMGNIGVIETTEIKIDKNLPTAPSVILSTENWTTENVTVTINSGTDSESGVAKVEYKIGSGIWQTYTATFTVSASGQTIISARTVDKAGNYSILTNKTVKIDKGVVPNPIINLSNNDIWSNVNVTVTIAEDPNNMSPSGINYFEYKIGTDDWERYIEPILLTTNGQTTISGRIVNSANNTSTGVSKIIKIDKLVPTTPVINLSRNGWGNTDVTFTIVPGTDNISGVSKTQYRIGTSVWANYFVGDAITIGKEGITRVETKTIDNAGNISASYKDIFIDKTNPSLPLINLSNTGWSSTNVTFTITGISDALSGVNTTQYKIGDAGIWTNYAPNAVITVSVEGVTPIYAKNIDNAGNETSISKNVCIDKRVPVNPIVNLSKSTWTSNDITFSVVIDAAAANSVTQYKIGDAGAWVNYIVGTNVTVSQEGAIPIHARTTSRSGIISSSSIIAYIDKTAPSKPIINASNTSWSSSNVTITITPGTDSLSGVSKTQYKIGDASWINYTGTPIVISQEGIVTFYAKTIDNVSLESISSVGIHVDKTIPTAPTINLSNTSFSYTDVTFTITPGSDILSGVNKTQYKVGDAGVWTDYVSGTTITISQEGTIPVYARTIDKSGNMSNSTATAYIDKTIETSTINLSRISWGNTEVTFTITPVANFGNNVISVEYRVGNVGNWTAYNFAGVQVVTVTDIGITPVYARIIDSASNESIVSKNILIDTTPPSVPVINLSSETWTNNLSFSLTNIADNLSGVSKTQYKIGNDIWKDYTTDSVVINANGQVNISAKAIDNVGNESSIATAVGFMSTDKPTGVITINDNAPRMAGSTLTVLLDITASTALTNVNSMMISNNSDFSGAVWENFESQRNWNVTTGFGEKTVYVKFRDEASNVSDVYSDTILRLATNVNINNPKSNIGHLINQRPKIITNADDFYSEYQIQISNNFEFDVNGIIIDDISSSVDTGWGKINAPYNGINYYEPTTDLGDGTKYIRFRIKEDDLWSLWSSLTILKIEPSAWTGIIEASDTGVKRIWVEELRIHLNGTRLARGLELETFVDNISTNITEVKLSHLAEIRESLEEIASSINDPVIVWTDPNIQVDITERKGIHWLELRNRMEKS